MLCRHPYIKDRSVTRLETRMSKEKRLAATPFPCGQCLPCRINQGRVWQHRILLETMSHAHNTWIGLTYNEQNLPNPPNVRKDHIQKFIKRLRKRVEKFRYLCVGEYGELWRPHYHLCLFGFNPINSPVVFDLWNKCDIDGFFCGKIEEYSAKYTAGYTTAKLTKRRDFEANGLLPEFMLSSRKKGGIGYPTIVSIAKKWRDSKWNDGRIIRELQNGKIGRPLGRYLTIKLAELLKIPEEKFEGEYWIHQEEIFDKHMKGDALDYYENITLEDKLKSVRQEKMHKIWKKRSLA